MGNINVNLTKKQVMQDLGLQRVTDDVDILNSKIDNKVGKTDYASADTAGVISTEANYGTRALSDGRLQLVPASAGNINERLVGKYKIIYGGNYDYAVKRALIDNEHAPQTGDYSAVWTEEDKNKARNLLNAVGKNDYAHSSSTYGIVKEGGGVIIDTGIISTYHARLGDINNRDNTHRPLVSSTYDYAIKQALTDNEHAPHSGNFDATWTEDDKTNARQLLNAEVAITTSTTTPSTLMNNTRYDLTGSDPVVTITLNPDTNFSRGDIMFTTGTTINLTTSNIKFKGRDCYSDGTFDIQPNTNYYINFIKFGNQVVGIVATI